MYTESKCLKRNVTTNTFTIYYIVVVRTAFAILSIEIMTFRKLHRQKKIKHFYLLRRLPSVCLSTRNHPLMMIGSEEIKSASKLGSIGKQSLNQT